MPRTATPSFPVVIISRKFDEAFRREPKEHSIEVLAAPLDFEKAKAELKRLRTAYPKAAMIGIAEFTAEAALIIAELSEGCIDASVAAERNKVLSRIQRAYRKAMKD